jgi:hypothetical protein
MKRRSLQLVALGLMGAVLVMAKPAMAQHGHTMLVTSDANGSGQLLVDWNFEGRPIARTSDSGLAGVFTGDIPGMNDGTGDGIDTFTLTDGTEISVEVMAIDENIRWIFSEVPPTVNLANPGETAIVGTMPTLHNHAAFEITGSDNKEFLEGNISFRVLESTASPVGYTPSDVHTLRVSNGQLPPLEAATEDHLKCQKTIAGAVRNLIAKDYKIITKCVDAALKVTMLAGSPNPALKACSIDELDPKSMVNDLAAVKTKAVDKIVKQCGALSDSSLPYTESHIHTHLGMARCRAEEMAGASYNHAVNTIGAVLEAASMGDAHDVQHALPCLKASQE